MVKENVSRIRQRILEVCSRINQDPREITIVAVSKGRGVEQIKEAVEAGISDIGENRVQEALVKHRELATCGYQASAVKWHMVGHLQTNKVKDAVGIFDLIQSVDSVRLAREIDRQSARINKIQDILIEVKTSPEATKSGLKPEEALEVIKEIAKFKNINIKGLMTIAPAVDNPQKARPYFRILRELRGRINDMPSAMRQMPYLSMGMTEDFEAAIEEGANMVRLGRAIFES